MSSPSKLIVLESSDDETFEVDEAVRMVSEMIKHMIEDDGVDEDAGIPVRSRSYILRKVKAYCHRHAETQTDDKTAEEDLKKFDAEFMRNVVGDGALFQLTLVADWYGIKGLRSLACQTIADMIKDTTPEEVRDLFCIRNDFTPEEEEKMRRKDGWAYDSTPTPKKEKKIGKRFRLPFRIQKKIMRRLPVKSLVKLRSVSKEWKLLIDSSGFIKSHSRRRYARPQHLLVANEVDGDLICFYSCIDNDTVPHQLCGETVVPKSIKKLFEVSVVGTSSGLICVRGACEIRRQEVAVIWNPIIRKSDSIPLGRCFLGLVGFGVSPTNANPILVALDTSGQFANVYSVKSCTSRCEPVKTVQHGTWAQTTTTKDFIYFRVDGKQFLSFNLSLDRFEPFQLPPHLASPPGAWEWDVCSMSSLRESLVFFTLFDDVCNLWMMGKNGLFEKMLDLRVQSLINDAFLGFSQNGMPIFHLMSDAPALAAAADDCDDSEPTPILAVYDTDSRLFKALELPALPYMVEALSYTETLLLSDCNFARSN